jgi:hypothetical protein
VHRPEPDVAGRHDLVIDKRPPAGIVEGRVALGPGELVEAGLGPALGDGTDARDVVAVGVGDEDAVEAAASSSAAARASRCSGLPTPASISVVSPARMR